MNSSKGIILYTSKYGSTKKYADWLKNATNFDCIETKKAHINSVKEYDTIILGGGIYASGISGLSFIKKHMDALSNKNIIVFCVGASPYDEANFDRVYAHNFKDSLQNIKCFYVRGAWNQEIMTFRDKMLCKMLEKMLSKKDPATFEPWEAALKDSIGKNCDWTDKKYLDPILEYINQY